MDPQIHTYEATAWHCSNCHLEQVGPELLGLEAIVAGT